MKKHILVIAQYFYPEQFRINDICTEWVKRGYEVTVITGIPNYPQGKYYDGYGLFRKRKESYNGINITRLPLIPRGKTSVMMVMNYLSFVVSGYFWKLFTGIKADYVFIFEVSPMTQALPGVWFAKRRKIPCYLYVQDLWPENVAIITGSRSRILISCIGKMVDYIYKRCARIFTTSKSFVTAINERGVSKDKIEYWPQYAEEFYKPMEKSMISEIPEDDSFNIIFAGNIGEAQGLDILPRTAAIIKSKSEKKIRFNIVGEGRYKSELMNEVGANLLEDMFNFIPKQPATRIPEFMAVCDAAFLSLTDNSLFEKTIPAKLQSYMACGIAIIASASGETERLINESKSGLCSKPGNAEELAAVIISMADKTREELKLFGANSRKYCEKNFNKQKLLDQMDSYFS